jgi:hypothetical protein
MPDLLGNANIKIYLKTAILPVYYGSEIALF